MENLDYIEINGDFYIRFYGRFDYLDCNFAKHHDCGGDLYLGLNGHLLCKKCKSTWPLALSRFELSFEDDVEYYYITQCRHPLLCGVSFHGSIFEYMGVDCYIEFLKNLRAQYVNR